MSDASDCPTLEAVRSAKSSVGTCSFGCKGMNYWQNFQKFCRKLGLIVLYVAFLRLKILFSDGLLPAVLVLSPDGLTDVWLLVSARHLLP